MARSSVTTIDGSFQLPVACTKETEMAVIAKRQAEVDAIHSEVFSERQRKRSVRGGPGAPRLPTSLDDVALLTKARKAKAGAKFSALYDRGDWQGQGFPSQSEADLWLTGRLAFWTGRDCAQIDSLFRRSALMREKWNRDDYRQHTLDTAVTGCSRVYIPKTNPKAKIKVGKHVSTRSSVDVDDKWNAARVAALIPNHFAQDEGGKLYVWRDGCYRLRGEECIRRALVRGIVPGEEWTSKLANETIEYIRVGSPHMWERPPRDKLNVQNGLLNLNTLALEPHSPDFLSPVQLSVRYDPEATCSEWENQIAATFPSDAAEAGVAWEIVAWLMTPHTAIQKALLLLGPGGTGKSTFLAALFQFLGGRINVSAIPLQKIETDRFAAARLVGKLANICADLPSTHLESSSVFKSITGGDPIPAEYKFKDSFDFVPFARLIFSANQPPQSKDATDAFFQRWYVLPFVNAFRDTEREIKRDQLDAKLATPGELSGVLNKAIAALPRVLKNGLTITDSMRSALMEFWRATDPLSIWLSQNTIAAPDSSVAKSALIEAYNSAAAREGRATMTATAFGIALKRLRPDLKEAQRTIAGKTKTWCYIGVGLRMQSYDDWQHNVA
jgi:P4 family phage/plasmid primase-like protien